MKQFDLVGFGLRCAEMILDLFGTKTERTNVHITIRKNVDNFVIKTCMRADQSLNFVARFIFHV